MDAGVALGVTYDDVYTAADNGQATVLLSLDLSAAFDTIDHHILVERLRVSFGVTGDALDWIASYLADRTQRVQIGTARTSPSSCLFGVPQGSVLGPILFTAYVSPIAQISESHGTRQQQYADDTQLYIFLSAATLTSQLCRLQSCVSSVQSWCIRNGLSLNPSKTEVICLGTSGRIASLGGPPSVVVSGSSPAPAASIKLLGVTLDNHLSFDKHVAKISQTSFYHIRALRHIRHLLDDDTAKTVAAAIVGSRLDYANAVLHGAPSGHVQRLQRVQNTLARVVLRAGRRSSASLCLQQLHWLPVKARIQFKIATLVKLTQLGSSPNYLNILLSSHQPARSLRSGDQHLLTIPRTRTVIGSRAFRVAGPVVWNNLPADLRSTDLSLSAFKSRLKTVLFINSFNDVDVAN